MESSSPSSLSLGPPVGQSWAGPGDGWGFPTTPLPGRATQLPEAPALGSFPATRPSEAPASFPVSFPTGLSLLGILFWLERGGGGVCVSGCFLLSHSSSLPPSCLSRCFLCQLGSTPASPLPGQTAAILSCLGLLRAVAFQSALLMPSTPRRGPQGMYFRVGAHCLLLPPLFKSPGRGGQGPTPGLPPAWGLSLSPSGPRFPGEPTANTAPWHRDT